MIILLNGNYFDLIVVDAPCSGSGLFRRDAEAINEWSLNNVNLCSQRQQRILADVLPALKPGGVLIYSTCSYSVEEDEEIVDWLQGDLMLKNEKIKIDPDWNIVESGGGYRFWPYKLKGEGFFIACFRKNTTESIPGNFKKQNSKQSKTVSEKKNKLSESEIKTLEKYVIKEELLFSRTGEIIYGYPENLDTDFNYLHKRLRVINFGIKIGEIIREKLIPDHALALSSIVSEKVNRINLELDQAIVFLKKKEVKIDSGEKGWSLITFQNHPLGWINILSNRINNYYPKELRILKD